MTKMNKIAVLTSGGDSPGMNAAIRAIVRSAAFYNMKCFGIYRGFQGLVEGDFKELDARSVKNIIYRGGTFLKSTRSEEFRTKEGRKKAFYHLKENGISGLIIIGGDGSLIGGSLFSEEFDFPVVGIPSTIDNDVSGTDFAIGYDTALNTVVEIIDKIRDTASSHNRLFLVEVMGRDAGDIALHAGIGAGAGIIMIPELNRGRGHLLQSLTRSKKSGKTSNIVVVAEGDEAGKNIFELAEFVEQNLQEYEVRVSVLGHIQRGGSPSCYDRVLASRLGVAAVDSIVGGNSNVMVGIVKGTVTLVSLSEITKTKKEVDRELIRVSDIISR